MHLNVIVGIYQLFLLLAFCVSPPLSDKPFGIFTCPRVYEFLRGVVHHLHPFLKKSKNSCFFSFVLYMWPQGFEVGIFPWTKKRGIHLTRYEITSGLLFDAWSQNRFNFALYLHPRFTLYKKVELFYSNSLFLAEYLF